MIIAAGILGTLSIILGFVTYEMVSKKPRYKRTNR